MWVLENNDSLTPLQLSAKLGVVEIFQYIINLENVYSFVSTHDGLFDVKLYDITEIDTVANQHVATIRNANVGSKNKKVARNVVGVPRITIKSNTSCDLVKCGQFDYPKTESILEMMFDYDFQNQSAFRIIETIPVKNIILEKWQKFKKFYFLWGFIHLFMTVSMTAELVIRSESYAVETTPNTTTAGNHVSVSSERFACGVSWMSLFLGAGIYAAFVGYMDAERKTPSYHNAVNEHFSSFGGAMLTMFKLMLGLDDFGVLNEARFPGLAIALYIVFALLTYVLLLNSLIAMMSQTCAVVLENRYPQWRLQQLSVVLFLEDILCMCCIRQTCKSPGTLFFPEKEISYSNQVTKQLNVRYFLKYIRYKLSMLQRKTEKQ
ncbi:unnamed protein product [Mytilus edulis]|uniref:Ion transport domain-containing protein n=1 Tax=Mytilus edulis TaxID=6550 RepID=A0A8S3Q8X1_MYTED|nr:unnamed protein product [Mytilus edulis]